MLNSKLYRACKNGQQRMIGMMDIGIPNPFYSDLTNELETFVSSFIPEDRYDRVYNCSKRLSEEKFDYLTELSVKTDIPEGWDDAMRYIFSSIVEALIDIGIENTEFEKVKSYKDLTVAEWVCVLLDCTETVVTNNMLDNE
jgi:hypothetical protein